MTSPKPRPHPSPFAAVLLAALCGCQALGAGRRVVLDWPAAALPPGGSDLHYEVSVWAHEGGEPTAWLLHRDGVAGNTLRVDATGWPATICWSVRTKWREGGRLRESQWYASGEHELVPEPARGERLAVR